MRSGVDEEWKTDKKVACANFLGIDPGTITRVQTSLDDQSPGLDVTVHIPIEGGGLFNFVAAHFVPLRRGQRVFPFATPLYPRFGKAKDGLYDNRKRTVEKLEFDDKNHIWWVWLKGKQHPFNARLLRPVDK
jgi:hypothetical protein